MKSGRFHVKWKDPLAKNCNPMFIGLKGLVDNRCVENKANKILSCPSVRYIIWQEIVTNQNLYWSHCGTNFISGLVTMSNDCCPENVIYPITFRIWNNMYETVSNALSLTPPPPKTIRIWQRSSTGHALNVVLSYVENTNDICCAGSLVAFWLCSLTLWEPYISVRSTVLQQVNI